MSLPGPLTMRAYRGDEDYWRIRQFLRKVFPLNGYREHSWDVVRFDYWRWHGQENIEKFDLDQVIFIWETAGGEIAAVLHPEGKGEAFLQVHPAWRTPELERDMLAVAEQHLAVANQDGARSLTIWAQQTDTLRTEILAGRAYQPGKHPEYQRRQSLDRSFPQPEPYPGYTLRSLGDGLELLERCYASGLVFHPGEIEIALDNRADTTWYRNIQNAPLYRRDLDVVAIAPDGSVAAFCTVWFDDLNRAGVFEPVGTVPAHQRRGLGKAILFEGLRRLQRMGATRAYVGSYSQAAGALYESVGFTQFDLSIPWNRQW